MNSKPVGSTGNGGGGGAEDYILIRDEKANTVDGGTFTSGVWQTRDLNTEVSDDGGHASLSSNQITLAAGTYRFQAHAPAFGVNQHKSKLRNISDGVDIEIGQSEFASAGDNGYNNSFAEGRFTLATSKTIELQHRCTTTKTTNGFGAASSLGVIEVYAVIEFWKEA